MAEDERDINSFRLVGNVGLLRPATTPGGLELLTFTVATHYAAWDSHAGKCKEETEWHDVVAFSEVATSLQQHLSKGTRVEVTGYLRTRTWEDRGSGEKHYRRELVAQDFRVIKRGLASSAPSVEPPVVTSNEVRQDLADAPRVRLF